MKLVIAGNYQQFRMWLRENNLTELRDARYVTRLDQVLGCRGAEIVFVGQHWMNPLADHMAAVRAAVEK